MEISIDQRIELITIIQTLCNYWENLSVKFFGKKFFQSKYRDNINHYFNKYKQHEAVRIYGDLCNFEPNISAFLEMILCFSPPPDLSLLKNIDNTHSNILKQDFIDSLKNFYSDTNFRYFFESNKSEYNNIVNDFNINGNIDVNSKVIFDYLDISNDNFKIIISPLVMGNFSISIRALENKINNYLIISPLDYKEGKYFFGSESSIKYLLWHEIAHTVVNDLTKKYISQSEIDSIIMPEVFKNGIYNNFETVINEYIIRAITFSLVKNNDANSLLEHETNNGFTEIQDIKSFIERTCEKKNKLLKDDTYGSLVNFVIEVLQKHA